MASNNDGAANLAIAVAAGAIAGAIGYFLFMWICQQGFYALVLPGGMVGIGAGLVSRRRSIPLAVICGVGALALGMFTEWRWSPMRDDPSFSFFVAHVYWLQPITLIMIAVGVLLAAYLGFGRNCPAQ